MTNPLTPLISELQSENLKLSQRINNLEFAIFSLVEAKVVEKEGKEVDFLRLQQDFFYAQSKLGGCKDPGFFPQRPQEDNILRDLSDLASKITLEMQNRKNKES